MAKRNKESIGSLSEEERQNPVLTRAVQEARTATGVAHEVTRGLVGSQVPGSTQLRTYVSSGARFSKKVRKCKITLCSICFR